MGKSLILRGVAEGSLPPQPCGGGTPGTWHVGCGVRGLEGATGRAAEASRWPVGKAILSRLLRVNARDRHRAEGPGDPTRPTALTRMTSGSLNQTVSWHVWAQAWAGQLASQ